MNLKHKLLSVYISLCLVGSLVIAIFIWLFSSYLSLRSHSDDQANIDGKIESHRSDSEISSDSLEKTKLEENSSDSSQEKLEAQRPIELDSSRQTFTSSNYQNTVATSDLSDKIVVDVGGAVLRPGVYTFLPGARVIDAIRKAGGFSAQIDREAVALEFNQAELLKENQKIFVPMKGVVRLDRATGVTHDQIIQAATARVNSLSPVSGSQVSGEPNYISLNFSSQKELETLPGVGEVRAKGIIESRPYLSLEDAAERSGMTSSIFSKVKDLVTLN